jgi:anaerobic dimethyl sulfoxide reductase subunit B (iron-sulfur subunit)
LEEGPWEIEDGTGVFNYNYIPVPTDLCDLCADRVSSTGKEPMCVHHCLANVITYGKIDDLVEKLKTKTKQVLWTPQFKPLSAKGKFVPTKQSNNEGFDASNIVIESNEEWTTAAHRRSDDDHFEFGLVQ